MLKVIHCADVHYKMSDLEEIDRCFKFVVNKGIEEKVDLAIVAGDFLDEYGAGILVEDEVLGRAVDAIQILANHCPVFMLYGTPSHERPKSLSIFAKLRAKNMIYVSDKIEQVYMDENGWFWPGEPSPNKNTIAVMSTLPPVNKAHLMAYRDETSKEVNHEIKDLLLDVFRGFGYVNVQYECPSIFVGHGTITGAKVSESQALVGKDIEFPLGDLKQTRADLYCLGHIHHSQSWDNVFYSGSICPLDFGEEEEKGFFIHEIM